MHTTILALARLSAADRARIEAIDPEIRIIDAAGWFDGEYRDTWPAFTVDRYLPASATGQGTRAERDAMLAQADIVYGGWPFPLDLRSRAPKLRWFHQRPAGASNLLRGDLWGSDVVVTTSRGAANGLAIAEYAVAGVMMLAQGLHRASIDRAARRFNARAYRPMGLNGKVACVVGAGGIGQQVGRLLAALGMRLTGTRRTAANGALPEGFAQIGAAADLDSLLPEADVVAVCCQWTPETDKLFNADRFGRMKTGSILVNVARGEIIDEAALVEALAADRLRGAVLDVYVGEFDGPPAARLWDDPRVVITPHVSGMTDDDRHGGVEIFCTNLRAWLDGHPLDNVVDWGRGY